MISPGGGRVAHAVAPPGQGPHSGDGTCDLTGHALRQLAERRGTWPGDDLTVITLETAKAGPLQAVTTAPNPHPAGPDQAVRAAPNKTVLDFWSHF